MEKNNDLMEYNTQLIQKHMSPYLSYYQDEKTFPRVKYLYVNTYYNENQIRLYYDFLSRTLSYDSYFFLNDGQKNKQLETITSNDRIKYYEVNQRNILKNMYQQFIQHDYSKLMAISYYCKDRSNFSDIPYKLYNLQE